MRKVSKKLSANDTSETGAHQAGMLIPKKGDILSFFPILDGRNKNPRCHLCFEDTSGGSWEFAFIYYNNKFFGGTRNEYRLTRMTGFFRSHCLSEGDSVVLERSNGDYFIDVVRQGSSQSNSGILVLGTSWRVIDV